MCAMLDGRSIETTVGFALVSGLPMATCSGDVRPGALFYLLRRKLFDDALLEKMPDERAGLLGLSGISGDMRGTPGEQGSAGGPPVSAPDSRVSVWVIPTNEELMIAQRWLAIVDGDA